MLILTTAWKRQCWNTFKKWEAEWILNTRISTSITTALCLESKNKVLKNIPGQFLWNISQTELFQNTEKAESHTMIFSFLVFPLQGLNLFRSSKINQLLSLIPVLLNNLFPAVLYSNSMLSVFLSNIFITIINNFHDLCFYILAYNFALEKSETTLNSPLWKWLAFLSGFPKEFLSLLRFET